MSDAILPLVGLVLDPAEIDRLARLLVLADDAMCVRDSEAHVAATWDCSYFAWRLQTALREQVYVAREDLDLLASHHDWEASS